MNKEMIKPYFPYGIRVAANGCMGMKTKCTTV